MNLAAARKKIESIDFYSQQLQQIITSTKKGVIPAHAGIRESDFSEEKNKKIEELFWMIEEYKVSLFAQELKTPYPVSPKKLDQLIHEIENTL